MLQYLWKYESFYSSIHYFSDGENAIFYPSLKLEQIEEKIQLYNTHSEMYTIMPTYLLWYAFEYSLNTLSESLCYTNTLRKLKSNVGNMKASSGGQYETLKKNKEKFEKLNTLTLSNIQNLYDEQRENCQAVQEVRADS